MYSWIFRRLPGPLWGRILIAILTITLAVVVLMEFVFPWASRYSPWAEPTLDLAMLAQGHRISLGQ